MQTVVGVFDTMDDAEDAREALIQAGFGESSVRVQSQASAREGSDVETLERPDETHESEGFMASVSRFFRDLFGTEDEHVGHYSEHVRRGGSVVTVDVDDESRVENARSVLASAGAVDINKRAESWREAGYSGSDATARPLQDEARGSERERVLPVVREELEVGKREVDLGAVRVVSRMQTRPVEEQVELREQRADIERRRVDRPATEADLNAFKEGTIEVHETAERAVVNKSARVVEEVRVGTETSSRTETISDQVRDTVVDVERDSDRTGRGERMGRDDLDSRSNRAGQGLAGDYDDDMRNEFRRHYEGNYASMGEGAYEDYEPAYRYGSELHSDTRYANRSWDEVELDARNDWAERYPNSSWERFKAAVRHGWDSMTGRR
ncbi:MAG: YsnF/AvaK domain-containing protein [Pseudomonadota bacterium]